jgi:DNA-binding winged helix-turn-helix (wHTH) protein
MQTSLVHAIGSTAAAAVPAIRGSEDHRSARYFTDLRIDGWLVQPTLNLLTRDDASVRLRAQLMDLLLCLASRPGRVFAKEDLVAEVWEGRWIAQSALSRCVAELRAALGDDAQRPRVIQTITKRGYRLIAPVEVVTVPAEPSPLMDAAAVAAAADAAEGVGDEAPRSFWQRLKLSATRAAIGAPGGAIGS